MRQLVVPGKTIDAVTPDELQHLLARELRSTPQRNITASNEGVTDNGTALVVIDIYKVPEGMEFELGWILLEVQGATFGAPLARPGCGAQVEVNGQARDVFPLSEDPTTPSTFRLILPQRKEYGGGGAIRIRNGSVLGVRVQWNTGNTIVLATIGGRLYSTPPAERHE